MARPVFLMVCLLGQVVAAAAVPGCRAAETTRATVDDLEVMATAVAASLRQAEPITRRGPGDADLVISIGELVNLSSDIVTRSEKRAIMNRIVNSQALSALARERNLRFIGEAELAVTDDAVRGGGRLVPDLQLRGELRTLTRAAADGRSDTYLATFDLLSLPRGEIVWTDRFEYKRTARGALWD